MSWMKHFFLRILYIYICIYLAQYELLIVGNINILYLSENFFTKEWAEPMPGVHGSATKDEKEESSSTPKKKKSFTSHVFCFGRKKTLVNTSSVFNIFLDQNSPPTATCSVCFGYPPFQVAQAPQARKWGVREVATFSDTFLMVQKSGEKTHLTCLKPCR